MDTGTGTDTGSGTGAERATARVGDTVWLKLPHSEVCMHLRVAGQVRPVRVLSEGAQILELSGEPFSFPVTYGEAGLRWRTDGTGEPLLWYEPATPPASTVDREVLTIADAVALGKILDAAHRGAYVGWLTEHGDVVHGTARHLVVDERTAAFPGDGDDVRDCYLRVSGLMETFLPVRQVIEQIRAATFSLDYMP